MHPMNRTNLLVDHIPYYYHDPNRFVGVWLIDAARFVDSFVKIGHGRNLFCTEHGYYPLKITR